MWVNLDDNQLDIIKGAMIALAEDDKEAAQLFWNDAVPDAKAAREACLSRAANYEAIAKCIDDRRSGFDPADPWREAAKEQAHDELEIDEDAVVSPGSDPGAWVHAWIWITDEQAGRFTCTECSSVFTLDRRYCAAEDICDECVAKEDACEDCGAELDEAGDGWDGKCADCADKIAAGE